MLTPKTSWNPPPQKKSCLEILCIHMKIHTLRAQKLFSNATVKTSEMLATKHWTTVRLQRLVHLHSSVTYLVNTSMFVFRWPCSLSSTYCFGHTCNVSADKVEVTFIFCRTRNHVESLEVKLHLLYSSVTYLLLVTNILPSTDILFKIQVNFGQEMIAFVPCT